MNLIKREGLTIFVSNTVAVEIGLTRFLVHVGIFVGAFYWQLSNSEIKACIRLMSYGILCRDT
jgi:hypothetical protein